MPERLSLVVILFLVSAPGLVPRAVGQIFSAPQFYSAGGMFINVVAVGDLNGDGIPDLVALDQCVNGDCNAEAVVGVLLGNGDGTFQAAQNYGTGAVDETPNSIALADVNGDGKLDILVAFFNPSIPNGNVGVIGVLLGNGDGTFQPAQVYSTGGISPTAIAVADVNGDGNADLIVNNNIWSSVGILLGNGDGTFQPVTTFWSGGSYAYSFGAADLNGDGKPDLAVLNGCNLSNRFSCQMINIFLGRGDSTFQLSQSYEVANDPSMETYTALLIGDVNADGIPDLILSGNKITVLLGNGDGTFRPAASSFDIGSYATVLADVNTDGKPDLVTAGCLQGNCSKGYAIGVLTGNGDGTFQPALQYSSNGEAPATVAVADVNRDGKPDLVGGIITTGGPAFISVWLSTSLARPTLTIIGSPQPPITKNAAGNYVAHVTITNSGNISIDSVQVTVAGTTLGTGSPLAKPVPITNLAPSASVVVTLKFPPGVVMSGATSAPLKISGTYSVSNPILSGNWNLSFRSVSLQ